MKVAAIIVNYNDEKDTIKFVEKINKYEVINRIIVVDNMSTTIGAFENLKKLENEKKVENPEIKPEEKPKTWDDDEGR